MRRGCRGDSVIAKGMAFLVVACAGSGAEAPTRNAAPRAPHAKVRSELFDAAKAWPLVLPRSPCRGHGDGRYVVEIRVSPAEADALRTLVLGGTMPIGTAAVAFHALNGTNEPASAYAMRKLPSGDWEYEVIDRSGELLAGGSLPVCARCHADAPADSLFVPRSAESAPGAAGSQSPSEATH